MQTYLWPEGQQASEGSTRCDDRAMGLLSQDGFVMGQMDVLEEVNGCFVGGQVVIYEASKSS